MCSCQGAEQANEIATISGGNDGEVPPVPIPNTEVKLSSAESTWLDTAREDKSLPDSIILSSSMAEHSAVNRVVVGSSPTWGAIPPQSSRRVFVFICLEDTLLAAVFAFHSRILNGGYHKISILHLDS